MVTLGSIWIILKTVIFLGSLWGLLGGPYFFLMDYEGWGKSFTRKNVSFVHLSHSLILKASSCRASSVKKNGQKIEKIFFLYCGKKFSHFRTKNFKYIFFVYYSLIYLVEPKVHRDMKVCDLYNSSTATFWFFF